MDNRYSFSEAYNLFFARCEKKAAEKAADWCCLAIDVEHFKLFNQVYGWERGDELLAAFIQVLQELDSAQDWVTAYLGQDDFAIFMPYDRSAIEGLFRRLSGIIAHAGNTVGFLPAVGVYCLAEDDPIDLGMYDKAVSAMLDAKKHRTHRICEHDKAAQEREKREFELLLELKDAMAEGLITFHLQPQCRISTQRIVGAEALARWVKRDGTFVSPAEYIPVLEKSGFIGDFDRIIWEKVCQWLRSLLDQGVEPVPISLNVSQMDILTMDVAACLTSLCRKYDLPTSLLKVEITESSYAESSDLVHTLVKQLKDCGFITMMDDFGSGYSSLNMLENVTVDVLKLDMVFIQEQNIHSRRGITIIESIVNMSKMMGLPIVVEGVETAEQVRFLQNLGCRYAQGYYFYKPMAAEEFETMLREPTVLDRRGFLCKMNEQFHVREFLDENTFTDTMLNNILGAVAFYTLDGRDLTINRFNQQFYQAIGDSAMETRQQAIQNYVVRDDWPTLYKALEDAYREVTDGATCEIRFYKSDGSVFWFRMHFFYLRSEQDRKVYYGQVEDVTEIRQQSLQLLEVLRKQAEVALRINLDQNTVQYVTGGNTLYQVGLPSIDLSISIQQTAENRIESEADRQAFMEFFCSDRLRTAYRKAIYHETLTIGFRMTSLSEPVEFSTYYIRHSKDQDLIVYAFAKRAGSDPD